MTSQTICEIADCNRPTVGRGLCRNHYEQARRAGRVPAVVHSECSAMGCRARAMARGFCDMHYRRVLRTGMPDGRLPEGRFVKSVSVDQDTGCWNWLRSRTANGYGRFSVGGKKVLPHRYSYEMFVGPIPDGLTIDHRCRNKACVNPDHLEAVTLQTNILRSNNMAARWAARTECSRGHSFAGPNGYTRKDGARGCRECDRIRYAARRSRQP